MCNSKPAACSVAKRRPKQRALPSLLLTHDTLPVAVKSVSSVPLPLPEMGSWGASKILEGLYLGDAGDALNKVEMKKHKITHVVNATVECGVLEDEEGYKAPNVLRIPVKDDCDAPLREYFLTACEFIHKSRAQGGNVLVHCRGGISRSSTLIAAYLMMQTGQTSDSTFDYLRTRRSSVSPNIGFLLSLESFEPIAQSLRKKNTPCASSLTVDLPCMGMALPIVV
eukprot:TRINITY_DN30873_c0_g1_i1.p1 TRINITY_DN30873_c0_g1~~TRINITY_DN30873_c0_g1_i1.p1  ORF type:complete len:225 (+),score=26.88 TRINITY_DN30873_c0_g1_i1:52-726(+)